MDHFAAYWSLQTSVQFFGMSFRVSICDTNKYLFSATWDMVYAWYLLSRRNFVPTRYMWLIVPWKMGKFRLHRILF